MVAKWAIVLPVFLPQWLCKIRPLAMRDQRPAIWICAAYLLPTAPPSTMMVTHWIWPSHISMPIFIAHRFANPINFVHFVACEEKILLEQEAHSQIRTAVLGIFFFSLLFIGIGQTAVSTLGIPYIDDNVASKESAIYIGNWTPSGRIGNSILRINDWNFSTAITVGVRILGPSAGFILGSFCTRLFVDLSDPGFGPSDPKWVGAWYLGEFLFIYSFCLFRVRDAAEFTHCCEWVTGPRTSHCVDLFAPKCANIEFTKIKFSEPCVLEILQCGRRALRAYNRNAAE